ncbi:YmaF family protein [Paenibacillus filicis]|uniref:YmaF family protein n=1 Tax=Paenibacillus gyeongsangnamensis TaxID=3388067 RepID=A0ABT4Q6E5_9BACL|nr:YmaF family protein [Paenibacillus filicis]MCZ8512275.1 YmaF family protein [Paenibacillus filicis]
MPTYPLRHVSLREAICCCQKELIHVTIDGHFIPAPAFDELRPSHAHHYHGMTSVTLNHRHIVDFYLYALNGSATDGHIHRYQGLTYIADRHFHRLIGNSGPAIPLPDGSHYHLIDGLTDEEPFINRGNFYSTVLSIDRHTHRLVGPTGRGIGYEDPFFLT